MLVTITIFIIALHTCVGQKLPDQMISDVSRLLKSFPDSGYDRNLRPNYGGPPVTINVTMYINDISAVSEVQMDYTIDFYFRQLWNDPRLAFNQSQHKGLDVLNVGAEFAKRIWLPDSFFLNGKQVSLHISTSTESNILLRITPNGNVLYSIRLTVVASCPMNLANFPMDSQLCDLKVASYGYATKDMDYHWVQGKEAFGIRDGIYLPTFKIKGLRRSKIYKALSTGNYTRLVCELLFHRSLGFYLNTVYIPALLIVVISWVPFWLDRDDTHARVGLGVTTVLTMTTLITSTNEALPKISYIKAIDVYLFTCFLMVFASLIEYATVGYFESSRKTKSMSMVDSMVDSTHSDQLDTKEMRDRKGQVVRPMRTGILYQLVSRHDSSRTDMVSRWVFPVVFALFNILYWIVYLNLSRQHYDDLLVVKDF